MAATEPAQKAVRPGTSSSPVAKKLLIKAGYKIGVVDAPQGFRESLGALPEGATLAEGTGTGRDAVIAFVRNSTELKDVLTRANDSVKADGLLWLCYQKGGAKAGTDLNRDLLYQAVKGMGYDGMGLVSFDDSWSAMRFKPLK